MEMKAATEEDMTLAAKRKRCTGWASSLTGGAAR